MTDQERSQIERINQVSAMARTSWITLLAYLAFIGVTLLAVEDADFFVPSRQTQLPLVDVAIPTASFFIFAPILAAALYVYLHIILLKLWDAIADIPYEYGASINGQPLGDHLNPWLVNDWALTLKGDPFTPRRPLRALGNIASFLLVWAAAPLILFGFWWRSMPAHDEWLTLLLAACFLLALHAGVTSWRTARTWLATPGRTLADRHWRHRDIWYLGAFFACFTLLRTEFPVEIKRHSTLAPTNLDDVELVKLPQGQRILNTARHAYRETWCRREGLEMAVCGQPADPDRADSVQTAFSRRAWCRAHGIDERQPCIDTFIEFNERFRADWLRERLSAIGNLPVLDLSGRDLRRAFGLNLSLVGADLDGARLQGASLPGSRLEGASLRWARLEGVDLSWARLEGASLRWARLERADLRRSWLEGADLYGAQLQGADLSGARLYKTDLSYADLNGADLTYVDLRKTKWVGAPGSPAHFADLRGAENLTQARLEGLIGNDGTLLPDGRSDIGEPWYVWSCWEKSPPDLDHIVAMAAGPAATDADRRDARVAFLCSPDNPRRKTGTPLALDAPYPEGHPLAARDQE